MTTSPWTTPAELVAQVQRLWDRGDVLRASLEGEALFPRRLRLRRPTASDLGARFDEVRRWIRALEEGSREHGYRLEFDEVAHRQLGTNQVPGQVLIETEADALRIIGKTRAAARFRALHEQTVTLFPALAPWLAARPMKALEHEAQWDGFLRVLQWFVEHPRSGLYRRQLEIEGVDTKFIETHRQVLTELLERVLPVAPNPDAVGFDQPPNVVAPRGFDQRFGLREKPTLVRFRVLDPAQHLHGLSDLTVPAADLAKLELAVHDVIVTENEINGLALLPRPRTLVVFGQGYALETLGEIGWLASRRLFYWGDLDTHGFAMLDRFRAHFPHAQSLLMDRATFLAHQPMWVTEKTPSTESLTRLTEPENALHRDLRRGTWGERLRLEQERIGFRWVRDALEQLEAGAPTPGGPM